MCSDSTLFNTQHPGILNKTGSFIFNLSGTGDALRLYDNTGILQYSMLYKNYSPWTNLPATANYTLEYVDTLGYLSPNIGTSWFADCIGGTPGREYENCFGVGVENGFIQNLQVYPNPTNGDLMLSFSQINNSQNNGSIILKDLAGRNIATLYQGKLTQEKETLHFDISQYAAGMYLLSVQQSEMQMTLKIVKW